MRRGLLGWLVLASCGGPAAPWPQTGSEPLSAAQAAQSRCAWPGGARAAVSLTYDDALPSQLKHAVPVLERQGLRATFFLSGKRLSAFAELTRAGHELGAHTVTHPCDAELARLSLDQMAAELEASIAQVHALGQAGTLTFAYPCGQTRVVGGASYVPEVRRRFRAARGVSPEIAEPGSLDLALVPAFFPATSSDGEDVIAFIERARQRGGWAVVGVHGVSAEGEYLQLSQPAHDRVVAYLAQRQDSLWTAPFGAVADVVAACQSRGAR